MDASEGSIESTYEYLMHGNVTGSLSIRPGQVRNLVDKAVREALKHSRGLTFPSIERQLLNPHFNKLPEDFRKVQALNVRVINDDPWTDGDPEYWFVEKNGAWHWVKFAGANMIPEFASVSSQHLVDRVTDAQSGLAHIFIISSVAHAFEQWFTRDAQRARAREQEMIAAAAVQRAISDDVRKVLPIPNKS